ncbi:TIM-barrel domain-containing protein [Pseudokineococcus sp. 5B2Z-1]|uniref:TIM-barrel domain-containing protein n=1 Tax=Pseudokineococcus sp. 5B2Z-1 TaxID=3132744 RepID=UPI003095F546
MALRTARRIRGALAAAVAAAVVTGAPTPVLAAPPPPPSPTPGSAADRAVVVGDARFEVLSPTLVRTEHAEDGRFEDRPSSNAVGRDAMDGADFTTSTEDGWFELRTSALTLRYRLGSGSFGPDDLVVSERAGEQAVTASPWPGPPTCEPGARCEAEDAALDGPGTATDHSGYSGSGFVAGFTAEGDSLTTSVTVAEGGVRELAVRYANDRGGDGQVVERTLSASVDGGAPVRLALPPTGSWDTWAVARVPLDLPAGEHDVVLLRGADDSGNVNVDSLAVLEPGAAFPEPVAPAPEPCAFGALCEADAGALSGAARTASDHDGASGDAFLAGLEHVGDAVALTVTGVPAAGDYDLQVRYANHRADTPQVRDRDLLVQAGGAAPTTTTLAPTSGWGYWRTVRTPLHLPAGESVVTLGCPDDDGCHVNLDTVAVTAAGAPLLAPHAPLGGYRRGLDGVDGEARTEPGVLHADGWTLLDDTASALVPADGGTPVPRPEREGDYQDGYVFGYGQDYAAALADLSALTGPTALLPRWAYGVWYSEYYDRTQSELLAINERARAEGVPMDVLVVDTDWKAGNAWDGWEVDTGRFPDAHGFVEELHSRDVRTSFNIHPSISGQDPRFPEAQATAGGALAPGSCGGGAPDCHVFDWGDPAQLQAYLDLHQPLDQDVDFWWLDWCCDSSGSSLPGVTPDAWINEQYATRTAPSTERGFAFSRAYGSLQAGGYSNPSAVPTGPWADKRTTLHFTGDTTSDWETLHYEVGYTPGESVATGNASVTHDIGGHTGGLQVPGTEPGATQLPADLYARWVQMGTFQPVDRLHSNHSDRLPWQYPEAARASATASLRLRERLVPLTYTLAREATATGTPVVRPLYLQYPQEQEAYARAGAEYLYGPDVLVAPVTTPGESATTPVWFPPGSSWTDWYTGETHEGGTTADVTTDLSTMPVFVRSGGVVTTRTDDALTASAPLDAVTVVLGGDGDARGSLHEDDGESADLTRSRTTEITASTTGRLHRVTVAPAVGSFPGEVERRTWTVRVLDVDEPEDVRLLGGRLAPGAWSYDAATRTLEVTTPERPVDRRTVVSYR